MVDLRFVLSLAFIVFFSVLSSGRFSSGIGFLCLHFCLSYCSRFSQQIKWYHLYISLSISIGYFICFWDFLDLPFILYCAAIVLITVFLYTTPHLLATLFVHKVRYSFSFPFFFTLFSCAFRFLSPWGTQGVPVLSLADSFLSPTATLFGLDGLTFISIIIPASLPYLLFPVENAYGEKEDFALKYFLISISVVLIVLTNSIDAATFTTFDPIVSVSGVVLPRIRYPTYGEDDDGRLLYERNAIDWAFEVSTTVTKQSKLIVWAESMLNVSEYSNGDSTKSELLVKASQFSKHHSVYLVTAYNCQYANGTILNELTMFDPSGDAIGAYTKRNTVFMVENDITPADWQTEPLIVDTEFGKVGLAICHDFDFPEFVRSLSSADLLISPSWDAKTWVRNTFGTALRSVELGVPFMRLTHGGWTGITNKLGRHVFGVSHWSKESNLIDDCPEWAIDCSTAGELTFTTPVPIGRRFTLHGFIDGKFLLFPVLVFVFLGLYVSPLLKKRGFEFNFPLYGVKTSADRV
ncbi:hypothetical protein P9112_011535 [Eukaryota sp. TZLM1-RC]